MLRFLGNGFEYKAELYAKPLKKNKLYIPPYMNYIGDFNENE